ncbi:endonuclease domain-containing 1 protein-like [Spinachia spinachia]
MPTLQRLKRRKGGFIKLLSFVCTTCCSVCRMSHKKMLHCFMGPLLLLLPCFGGLVLGEISEDFSQCLDFFYKETPPKVKPADGYQPICQRYQNKYRFATLYDRQRRSPLYSAYVVSPVECSGPKPTWMFEPQLASHTASPEMQDPIEYHVDQNVIESQAVDEDYKNSDFTRGHLNPNQHQGTPHDCQATFTLTNIVPQREGSNKGPWEKLEKEVLRKFNEYCTGPMYAITGVIPYESEQHLMNNRVSVPEYMWSAYCCPNFQSKLPNPEKAAFPMYAAVGRNDPDSTEEIVPINVKAKPNWKGYDVRRMSVTELEEILTRRLGGPINLFDGQCK